MAYCSYCGSKIEEDARFCAACGRELPPAETADSAAEAETPAPEETTTAEEPATAKEETAAPPVDDAEAPPAAEQPSVSASPENAAPEINPITPTNQVQNGGTGLKPKWILIIAGGVTALLLVLAIFITVFAIARHAGERDLSTLIRDFDRQEEPFDIDDWDNWDDWDYDYDDEFDYIDPSDYDYHNDFLAADFPTSWQGHYIVHESDDGNAVTFCSSENELAGFGGRLVTVARYKNRSDYENLPSYELIFSDDSYDYVAIYPTDVQFNNEDQALAALYRQMNDDLGEFIEDMEFFE